MSDLPASWVGVSVKIVSELSSGFGFPVELQGQSAGEIGFIKVGDISRNFKQGKTYLSKAEHYVTRAQATQLRVTPLSAGSVVFAKIGAAVALNRRAILRHASLVDNNVMGLSPSACTFSDFLYHFMCQVDLGSKTRGGNVPSLRKGDVEDIPFPLPPLNEQKRIVAKIDELFSELDAGEESLRRARQQLGVYRQSLLKQAFEGKLSAHWRDQNPDKLESPLVPPVSEIVGQNRLAEVPPNWVWSHLSDVGELGRGKSMHRPRNDARLFGGAYPFIQTGEVRAAEKTVNSYAQTYSEFGLAQSKLWAKGTLCITIAANIAETAFLGFDACFPDSVVGFVPDSGVVISEFVEMFLRSARSRIEKYAPATAQKNINLSTLEGLLIPLCSLPEQQEIVRLLDEQFDAIAQNEREIDGTLKRSAALRQSILKEAFSGQLVPQDATDEPASILLARILGEREAIPAKKRISRKASEDLPVPVKPTEKEWFPEIIPFKPLGRTDLQAGIVALAVNAYVEADQFIGHTITEKIVHLSDYIADLNLDRHPIKDVAGPNDYKKAKAVEHRAKMKGWFTVQKKGDFYLYNRGRHLDRLLEDTRRTLGAKLSLIEDLLKAMIRFDTHKAEVFATVYAAWNNLLLQGHAISDEAIVTEARENWHPSKLKIDRESFFKAITWMRRKGFVPKGTGHLVGKKSASAK